MSSPVFSDPRSSPFDLESLARALTAADARLVIWKGGRELAVQGDLDCSAPRAAWAGLAGAFESWARSHDLGATVVCEHAIGMLVLVGCGGTARDRLLQLDLVDALLVHGASAWRASDAARSSSRTDGIRHTTPGAEGMLRRLADRSDRGAAELVARDPAGADRVVEHLGVRGKLASRGGGAWSRLALEAVLAGRAFLHPLSLARAIRSDPPRKACPLLQALRNDRTVEGALEPWLDEVSSSHEVSRLDTRP